MRRLAILLFTATSLFPADPAIELYRRTEYQQSLAALLSGPHQDPAALQLMGQNYFMLGEYKKSTEALEKAAAIDPTNAKLLNWLGRAYGRRARRRPRIHAAQAVQQVQADAGEVGSPGPVE